MPTKQSHCLKHCLSIEDWNKIQMLDLFQQADQFLTAQGALVPLESPLDPLPLKGKVIANLFIESSTRTRCSFELAAAYLGAHVLNFNFKESSTEKKGETLVDTLRNLEAMGVRCFVIRHSTSGAVSALAHCVGPTTSIINAGDGTNGHPTQALLDMYTLWRRNPDFSQYRVAIVGDIAHSRVARSQIQALSLLNAAEVRVVAPASLLPKEREIANFDVKCYDNLEEGLDRVNVIIALRIQKERMAAALLKTLNHFHSQFGITDQALNFASPDAVVMHPGPVNYGVEITPEVAHGSRSLILQQVTNGVALRMALLVCLAGWKNGG